MYQKSSTAKETCAHAGGGQRCYEAEQGQLLSLVVLWNVSEVKRINKSCSEERAERKCSKALCLFLPFNFTIYKLENVHLTIYKIFSRCKTQCPVSISFRLYPNALSPQTLLCLTTWLISACP